MATSVGQPLHLQDVNGHEQSQTPLITDEDAMQRLDQHSDKADLVKKLLYYNLQRSALIATKAELSSLRQQVLGVDRIKSLILSGCSPEDIQFRIANTEIQTKLLQQHLMPVVKSVALGHAIAQTAAQIGPHKVQDPSAQLQALQRNVADLTEQELPTAWSPAKDPIDYFPLHDFVETEKEDGALEGDCAWEHSGRKAHHKWDYRLASSIKKLSLPFETAVAATDFDAANALLLHLIDITPSDVLSDLVQQQIEKPVVELARGPAMPDDTNELRADAEALAKLGEAAREDILSEVFKRGAEAQNAGAGQLAEKYFHDLLNTGYIRWQFCKGWGTALASLDRYEEAEKAFTLSLNTLATHGVDGHRLEDAASRLTRDEIGEQIREDYAFDGSGDYRGVGDKKGTSKKVLSSAKAEKERAAMAGQEPVRPEEKSAKKKADREAKRLNSCDILLQRGHARIQRIKAILREVKEAESAHKHSEKGESKNGSAEVLLTDGHKINAKPAGISIVSLATATPQIYDHGGNGRGPAAAADSNPLMIVKQLQEVAKADLSGVLSIRPDCTEATQGLVELMRLQ